MKKDKLIYSEKGFNVYSILNHPNGACYLLEKENGEETCKGVIGEYFYLKDKFKERIKKLNISSSKK